MNGWLHAWMDVFSLNIELQLLGTNTFFVLHLCACVHIDGGVWGKYRRVITYLLYKFQECRRWCGCWSGVAYNFSLESSAPGHSVISSPRFLENLMTNKVGIMVSYRTTMYDHQPNMNVAWRFSNINMETKAIVYNVFI